MAHRYESPGGGATDVLCRTFEEEQMKQTTYKVVTSDDQNLREDPALFERENEARTYARVQAQGGCGAYVLKVETELLTYYAPETAGKAKRSGLGALQNIHRPRGQNRQRRQRNDDGALACQVEAAAG